MATSGQPCMLRFRSAPVRLMQTFIVGLPTVMGIFGETQEIRVKILKHKEGYLRTEAIKVTLKPRAGSPVPAGYLRTEALELYKLNILWREHLHAQVLFRPSEARVSVRKPEIRTLLD